MRTPDERSPYGLIQEDLWPTPWRLLVACIMLNLTSRRQAQPVWEELFRRWPTPEALWVHDDRPTLLIVEELTELLRPLGLQNRRALSIWRMTFDYLVVRPDLNRDGVLSLSGVGKYASDSWRIFVDREIVHDVQDKELRRYVEWAGSRGDARAG